MRLIIAAVGRLKDGPERALFEKYRDRFEPLAKRLGLAPVAWHEIGESRAADTAKRRDEEGAALLKLVREAEFVIALDERGKQLDQRRVRQDAGQDARRRRQGRRHHHRRAGRAGQTPCAKRPGCRSPSVP